MEDDVWCCSYPFRSIGHRNGFFSRKPKVARSGTLKEQISTLQMRSIFDKSRKSILQQGKVSEAEKAIKTLYGKERVVELVRDLSASGQGSSEPEAGWFDLFSSRYWKGIARLGGDTLFSL